MTNLYLVSTPIGNLNDISLRAKETLAKTEIILAEDTRKTGKMLKKLGVSHNQLVSYYEENEAKRIPEVINWLKQGKDITLVSNSGTPLISDPGYKLVREVINQGFKIIAIPGASALISALIISGLPIDRFTFFGFLPKKQGKKRELFKELGTMKTIVFYESPNRIIKTLEIIKEIVGDVDLALCRELTKLHEKVIRGNISQVLLELNKEERIKGEITVVLYLVKNRPVFLKNETNS